MSELDKFKRRMIRSVARRIVQEGQNEDEVWEDMTKQTGCDCKLLWNRMRTLTIKKLKRLLAANDYVENVAAVARLSYTDWLLYDLVLVHEKIDVIDQESIKKNGEGDALIDLYKLVCQYDIENLSGTDLAAAWSGLTKNYNSSGRQCSPMLLQRRWHELKALTRRTFYALWSKYRGNNRYWQPALGDSHPTQLQAAIAKKFPNVITTEFLEWEALVEESKVILPEEFEMRIRKRVEIPSDGKPDIVMIEPQIETIDLGADSDDDIQRTDVGYGSIQPQITVKQEKTDSGIEPTTSSTQANLGLVKQEPVEVDGLTNVQIVATTSVQECTEDDNDVDEDANDNATLEEIQRQIDNDTRIPETIQDLKNAIIDDIVDKSQPVVEEAPKEPVPQTNEATDVEPHEDLVKQKVEEYLRSLGHAPEEPKDKTKTNVVEEVDDLLKKKAEGLLKRVEMNELENMLHPQLPFGFTFDEDGIEFVDDGIEFNEDDDTDVKIKTEPDIEVKLEVPIEKIKEDPEADVKLIMKPIVYTTKLDLMPILKGKPIDSVDTKALLEEIIKASKPIKYIEVKVEPIQEGLVVKEEKSTVEEIENTDNVGYNSVNEDVPRVKPTSHLLQKPRYRTYHFVQVCKNPDFNTRLKRLTAGFFSSLRNRQLLSACKPVTIDLNKAFESKLVGGTIYLKQGDNASMKQPQATAKGDEEVYANTVVPSAMAVQSLLTPTSSEAIEQLTRLEVELTQPEVELTRPEVELTRPEVELTRPEVELTPPELELTRRRCGPAPGPRTSDVITLDDDVPAARSKVINLPDLSEIRRINQQLLTAEVSPMRVDKSAEVTPSSELSLLQAALLHDLGADMPQEPPAPLALPTPPASLAPQEKITPLVDTLTIEEDAEGPSDQDLLIERPPQTLPRAPGRPKRPGPKPALVDKDKMTRKLPPRPTYTQLPGRRVDISWIPKTAASTEDGLITMDTLVRMIYKLNGEEDKLWNGNKKKKLIGLPENEKPPKKPPPKPPTKPGRTCCWAREKIEKLNTNMRCSRHVCKMQCRCCCRDELVKVFTNKDPPALPSPAAAKPAPKRRARTTYTNKVKTNIITEHHCQKRDLRVYSGDKVPSRGYPCTCLVKSGPRLTQPAYRQPQPLPQPKPQPESQPVIKINVNFTNEPIETPAATNVVTRSDAQGTVHNIIINPSVIKSVPPICPMPSVDPGQQKIVIDASTATKSDKTDVVYLRHDRPKQVPIHLGRNKILLTTVKFPPHLMNEDHVRVQQTPQLQPLSKAPLPQTSTQPSPTKVSPQATPTKTPPQSSPTKAVPQPSPTKVPTLPLPTGVQLVLMPDGQLTFVAEPNVVLTDADRKVLETVLTAVQQQIANVVPLAPNLENETQNAVDGIISDTVTPSTENVIDPMSSAEIATNEAVASNSLSCSENPQNSLASAENGNNTLTTNEAVENVQNLDVANADPPNESSPSKASEVENTDIIPVINVDEIETRKETGPGSNLLSDLMEMSGISAEDTTSLVTPTAGTSVPNVTSVPLSTAGISAQNTPPMNSPDVSQDNISMVSSTSLDEDTMIRVTNATPPSVTLSNTDVIPDLHPISSLAQLKYACDNNGKFFKLNLENGLIIPINVCIRKNAFKKNRKKPEGTMIVTKAVIDLTDDTPEDTLKQPIAVQNSDKSTQAISKIPETNITVGGRRRKQPVILNKYASHSQDPKIGIPRLKPPLSESLQLQNQRLEDPNIKPVKLLKVFKNLPPNLLKHKNSVRIRREKMSNFIRVEPKKTPRKQDLNSIEARIDLVDSDAPMEEEYLLDSFDSDDSTPTVNLTRVSKRTPGGSEAVHNSGPILVGHSTATNMDTIACDGDDDSSDDEPLAKKFMRIRSNHTQTVENSVPTVSKNETATSTDVVEAIPPSSSMPDGYDPSGDTPLYDETNMVIEETPLMPFLQTESESQEDCILGV